MAPHEKGAFFFYPHEERTWPVKAPTPRAIRAATLLYRSTPLFFPCILISTSMPLPSRHSPQSAHF